MQDVDEVINAAAKNIRRLFMQRAKHMRHSRAFSPEHTPLRALIRAALDDVADAYSVDGMKREYNNLRKM